MLPSVHLCRNMLSARSPRAYARIVGARDYHPKHESKPARAARLPDPDYGDHCGAHDYQREGLRSRLRVPHVFASMPGREAGPRHSRGKIRPRAESSLYRACVSLCVWISSCGLSSPCRTGVPPKRRPPVSLLFPIKAQAAHGKYTFIWDICSMCVDCSGSYNPIIGKSRDCHLTPPSRGTVARLFRFSIAPSPRSYATAFLISWGRPSGARGHSDELHFVGVLRSSALGGSKKFLGEASRHTRLLGALVASL